MSRTIQMSGQDSSSDLSTQTYEDDLQPYLSLFIKPLTHKKSEFTEYQLAQMCKDPLHSPELIRYLIEFVREL